MKNIVAPRYKNSLRNSILTLAKTACLLPAFLLSNFFLHAQTKKPAFSVTPLGVKGGLDESNLSAYLVGATGKPGYVCLDAGTLHYGIEKGLRSGALKGSTAGILKRDIKAYLISHPHLDHVSGLILNSPDDTVKNIYALPFVINTLKEKYFTWQSWANFADAGEAPQLKKYHYATLMEERDAAIENTTLRVTAFPLSHSNPGQSTAFLLKNGESYLLYLGDTGPDSLEHSKHLSVLWQKVAPLVKTGLLRAIFIEVSFPNEQPDAQLFGHLTPRWLMREMTNLSEQTGAAVLKNFPLVITHSKLFGTEEQNLRAQLAKENKLGLKLFYPEQGKAMRF